MIETIVKKLSVAAAIWLSASSVAADLVIDVPAPKSGEDMTAAIQSAIDQAKAYSVSFPVRDKKSKKNKPEEIIVRLSPGAVYNISRSGATPLEFYVSNTTTREENPDPTKHFGLWLPGMHNVRIDGRGATLLTHGEMTAIGIDSCSNISISNLNIDAADPSVPEMTVVSRTDSTLTARVSAPSRYSIASDGKLFWEGEGWRFTGGIAQIYADGYTLRCKSPMDGYRYASKDADGNIVLHYAAGNAPECEPGTIYQMRHSIRNEVATLISRSEGVKLFDMNYRFLGNFGIVAQMSSDIAYDRLKCLPDPESGRTCAGFADFMQVSGCRGLVKITGCDFAGAQDDPINVHGTHLEVVSCEGRDLTVRYMHGQTRGFDPAFPDDEIALTNPHTLIRGVRAKVKSVEPLSDTDYRIRLDRSIEKFVKELNGDAVIENISANPDVEITHNTFTLTPTRGILLTTSGKTLIAENTFIKIPMASILIADDARSWFESGPVMDVTIRDNQFIDCSSPVIQITPENDRYAGAIHEGISIIDNKFIFNNLAKDAPAPVLVKAHSVKGLRISGNTSNVATRLDIRNVPK